jgi:hypothetical protein
MEPFFAGQKCRPSKKNFKQDLMKMNKSKTVISVNKIKSQEL